MQLMNYLGILGKLEFCMGDIHIVLNGRLGIPSIFVGNIIALVFVVIYGLGISTT